MPFKVLIAPYTLDFGKPTLILAQFPRGEHHVVLESILIVRPNNHVVSCFKASRVAIDRRPNTDDIRSPYRADVQREAELFEEAAKQSFITYGMNLPQYADDKPNEPIVEFSEVDKRELLQMLMLGTGHDELRNVADSTKCDELGDFLRHIIAIAPPPKPAPDVYKETVREDDPKQAGS